VSVHIVRVKQMREALAEGLDVDEVARRCGADAKLLAVTLRVGGTVSSGVARAIAVLAQREDLFNSADGEVRTLETPTRTATMLVQPDLRPVRR